MCREVKYYLSGAHIIGECSFYTFEKNCPDKKEQIYVDQCKGKEPNFNFNLYEIDNAEKDRLTREIKRFKNDLPKKLEEAQSYLKDSGQTLMRLKLTDRDRDGKVDRLSFVYTETYPQVGHLAHTDYYNTSIRHLNDEWVPTSVTIEASAKVMFCAEALRYRGEGCNRGEKTFLATEGQDAILANRRSKLNKNDICVTGKENPTIAECEKRLALLKVDSLRNDVRKFLRPFDKFLRTEKK